MPAATLSVLCLLCTQADPGLEFEPKPRAPALRLSDSPLGKPRSPEPKTIIQPSSRKPPVTLERDEPEEDANDFPPPASLRPRASRPAAPVTLEPEVETFAPPARRADVARSRNPAGYQEPNQSKLASTLLKNAVHNRHGLAEPGGATTLHAALERTSDRAAQIKVVKSYWLLVVGIAEHHYAVNEMEFLESLPGPRTAHEQAVLAASRASAAAHLRQAELAAAATQQDLVETAQLGGKTAQPFPVDTPYVGNYRTSFKEIFANRPAPAALKRIDRTLPYLRDLIESQAAAVSAADKSLYALSQAYEDGEADLALVVEGIKHLRRQRREFLSVVRDYNFSIADYALAVANPSTSRGAVVAMLIESPTRTKSVLVSPERDVLPASREVEFEPESEGPAFRAPASRDLVPVPPPSLRPSEFAPPSRSFR